jgi:hypothetical protein
MYMANTTNNPKNNAQRETTVPAVPATKEVKTMSETEKQQSQKIDIAALYAEAAAKHAARKSKPGGNSLPYAEITEAVDKIFDEAQLTEAPISVLVQMTNVILTAKYAAMKDSKVPISYKQGRNIRSMPEGELKKIRQQQLAAMVSGKQKDNLYRRIYGLGYREEFKRFELAGQGVLRRIKSPSTSSTKNGSE